MRKKLKLKTYRPSLDMVLNEDDYGRRMLSNDWYIIRQEAVNDFYKNILWTDEANFKMKDV